MTSPTDLAARLRTTYHVADLPADNPIRLAADEMDRLESEVEQMRALAEANGRERDELRKSEDAAAAHAAECVRLQWAAENQRDAFAALLREARYFVESDVAMMDAISRHMPLPAAEQAVHDTTEYPSEALLKRIDAALKVDGNG